MSARDYDGQWRIFDKGINLVAMHHPDEGVIRKCLRDAPRVLLPDLVILKPTDKVPYAEDDSDE